MAEAEARELQSKDSQQLAISKKLHAETKELEAALEDIALKQSEILKAAQLEQVMLFSCQLSFIELLVSRLSSSVHRIEITVLILTIEGNREMLMF